jgi:hypothetical protein
LSDIKGISDSSPNLLESLSGSLATVYYAPETFNPNSTAVCYGTLGVVSSLAQQGYLSPETPDTGLYLIRSVSAYVVPEKNESSRGKVVSESLTNITEGLLNSLTHGQEPVNLISDNLQISLRNDLSVDLDNSTLSAPDRKSVV